MQNENKFIFNGTQLNLPIEYQDTLKKVIDNAIQIFGKNLKSMILGGSGGKSNIITLWSDLDVYIVLNKYDKIKIENFMDIVSNFKIHVGVTIYTLEEVKNDYIDGKTKVMIYEKNTFNFNPTLLGKNYFLNKSYEDIQRNDIHNLPNIVHTCRRNFIDILNNKTLLTKKHIKKFIVLLKCILNIQGMFSYGYLKVMNDFYQLCEEKKLLEKLNGNFSMEQLLKPNYDLQNAKDDFLLLNEFVFTNLVKLLKNDKMKKKIISCMGIVCCKKDDDLFVALLQDENNNWVIPKGHNEVNEHFIESAMREVYEETKLKLTLASFIDKVGEYKYFSNLEDAVKIIKVYCFKVDDLYQIIPQKEEKFKDGKWLKFEEALEMVSYSEQREMLLQIIDLIV